MNNQTLLSICIPTYNRGEMLEQSILYMIPVCRDNNIQIFVSDNASPDNTQDIMKVLSNEYGFIHYHRHTRNIGSDDNFEYVLKMSCTKYRWLMSDTCYVDDIADLMMDLKSEDWDGYILNGDPGRAKELPKEKKSYSESISVMHDMGWHLTWISCMIYNERLVKSLDFKRFRSSSFNQTALMFETTANRNCRICFNPLLVVKNLPVEKESGWQYRVFDVMYRQWYMLIMSLPIYYPYEIKEKCIIDAIQKPVLLHFFFHLLRRKQGKWTLADVKRNSFFIKYGRGGYLRLMIIGCCPVFLLKLVFKLGKCLNSFLRYIGLMGLRLG